MRKCLYVLQAPYTLPPQGSGFYATVTVTGTGTGTVTVTVTVPVTVYSLVLMCYISTYIIITINV